MHIPLVLQWSPIRHRSTRLNICRSWTNYFLKLKPLQAKLSKSTLTQIVRKRIINSANPWRSGTKKLSIWFIVEAIMEDSMHRRNSSKNVQKRSKLMRINLKGRIPSVTMKAGWQWPSDPKAHPQKSCATVLTTLLFHQLERCRNWFLRIKYFPSPRGSWVRTTLYREASEIYSTMPRS